MLHSKAITALNQIEYMCVRMYMYEWTHVRIRFIYNLWRKKSNSMVKHQRTTTTNRKNSKETRNISLWIILKENRVRFIWMLVYSAWFFFSRNFHANQTILIIQFNVAAQLHFWMCSIKSMDIEKKWFAKFFVKSVIIWLWFSTISLPTKHFDKERFWLLITLTPHARDT